MDMLACQSWNRLPCTAFILWILTPRLMWGLLCSAYPWLCCLIVAWWQPILNKQPRKNSFCQAEHFGLWFHCRCQCFSPKCHQRAVITQSTFSSLSQNRLNFFCQLGKEKRNKSRVLLFYVAPKPNFFYSLEFIYFLQPSDSQVSEACSLSRCLGKHQHKVRLDFSPLRATKMAEQIFGTS